MEEKLKQLEVQNQKLTAQQLASNHELQTLKNELKYYTNKVDIGHSNLQHKNKHLNDTIKSLHYQLDKYIVQAQSHPDQIPTFIKNRIQQLQSEVQLKIKQISSQLRKLLNGLEELMNKTLKYRNMIDIRHLAAQLASKDAEIQSLKSKFALSGNLESPNLASKDAEIKTLTSQLGVQTLRSQLVLRDVAIRALESKVVRDNDIRGLESKLGLRNGNNRSLGRLRNELKTLKQKLKDNENIITSNIAVPEFGRFQSTQIELTGQLKFYKKKCNEILSIARSTGPPPVLLGQINAKLAENLVVDIAEEEVVDLTD